MQKNRKKAYVCLAFALALLTLISPLQSLAEPAQSTGVLTDDPDMEDLEVIDLLRLLPKIKEIIKKLNMLSEEEVQSLLDAEKITTPVFAQIDELQGQENAVRESIRQKHKEVYDAYDIIYDKTKYLWKKIHDNANENSPLDDPIAMIQQSSLSAEDKKILLDAEAEREAMDEALMKAEDEMADAIRPISEKMEALEATIYPLREKLMDIFTKLENSEYYLKMIYGK